MAKKAKKAKKAIKPKKQYAPSSAKPVKRNGKSAINGMWRT